MTITEQGTIYSPCGEWGCGDHGTCINNTCKCDYGWTGVSCQVPSPSPPNPNIGDFECGNWGVYGKLNMGRPGLAPTCDCKGTHMLGERCELECESDTDCGSGTCDTSVGRCECSKRCFADTDCELGECKDRVCTDGWTGVQCSKALSNICRSDSDCNDQTCDEGTCLCDDAHTGLRCEVNKSVLGESCEFDADCIDATRHDTCSANTCIHFGTACETDLDCRVSCDGEVCALPGGSEHTKVDDPKLIEQLGTLIDQLLTLDGLSQMAAEELIEFAVGPGGLLASGLATKKAIKRAMALRSAKVGILKPGQAVAVKKSVNATLAKLTYATLRKNVGQMATKMGSKSFLKGFGILYFAIQALGMVLDIDDSAGFNAQIPQDGIDLYMKKIMKSVNDMEELRQVGVQFPREYMPRDTIRYRAKMEGDVAGRRREELVQDYINRLDVNSNGVAILRDFSPPPVKKDDDETPPPPRNKTLLKLSGSDPGVYEKLETWWWLILALACVLILTVGLSVGLTVARSKHNKL